MKWFQNFFKYITMPFIAFWLRVSFYGRENLPEGGGYILSCNHNSNLDPIVLTWPLKVMVCYMGKEQLFRPPYGWLFYGVGAFPVERGTGDLNAVEVAKERVARGDILGMFPEGTRRPVGQPGRPKSGAALVARTSQADVLPCAIHYSNGLRFRSRVSVYYGRPIKNSELFEGDEGPRQIKRATKRMWGETTKFLEEHHGISPDNS